LILTLYCVFEGRNILFPNDSNPGLTLKVSPGIFMCKKKYMDLAIIKTNEKESGIKRGKKIKK
jgi:hypothetical protein